MTDEPRSGDSTREGGETEWVEAARQQAVGPAAARDWRLRIEGYEILREIHRGGQGAVYQAIQKATKRKVAIKVMHEGPFAGSRDRARFEREVQILAALKHPNIVGIHDSGVADGHFYYVMDYISGKALDAYMTDPKFSRDSKRSAVADKPEIDTTLRLLAKICEIVNSAHLKGVIHRDLKPGNIRIDSSGEPHVLDFGLAKLATGDVTDASSPQVMTLTGQFIGSMPWASPEQAEGAPDKIDIRTDVYSLGVVLYQMLTGRFPYEVVGNMRDVLDNILRAEPARPSTVRRQINNEVETIVLKCLAKERERRYQSAGELARDVGRYLAGEPIEAKRDSAMYVLRKQLRKHRVPVGVAACFLLTLAASTVGLSVMYESQKRHRSRAEESRALAEERREEAETARIAERTQREVAERQTEAAEYQAMLANIYAADAALQKDDIGATRRRLDAVPQALRNWEWNYLNASADASIMTFHGDAQTDPRSTFRADFSPDGTRIAITTAESIRFHDARSGTLLESVMSKKGSYPVAPMKFSPSGSRAMILSATGAAELWNIQEGRLIGLVGEQVTEVGQATFSPDGQALVLAQQDGEITIWETANGSRLHSFRSGCTSFRWVGISPDCRFIATLSKEGACLWELLTGLHILQVPAARSPSFSTDGSRVFTTSYDGEVPGSSRVIGQLWETATGREVCRMELATASQVHGALFSPDGTRIAIPSSDGTSKLYGASDAELLFTINGEWPAQYSPDSRHLITVKNNAASIWDVADGTEVAKLSGHDAPITSVQLNVDATRAITRSDRTGRLWDIASKRMLREVSSVSGTFGQLRFSSSGRLLVGRLDLGPVRLWDAVHGAELGVLRGHGDSASATFSPDDATILTFAQDNMAKLWDAAAPEGIRRVRAPKQSSDSAVRSPAGERIVILASAGSVQIVDTENGEAIATLFSDETYFTGVLGFSPNGLRVMTSWGSSADVWDALTGRHVRKLGGHTAAVTSGAFDSNCKYALTASLDGSARLWEMATGTLAGQLRDTPQGFVSIAFNPDGSRIVTRSFGSDTEWPLESPPVNVPKSVSKVWDAESGLELATLPGVIPIMESSFFSPDGGLLVCLDGTDGVLVNMDSFTEVGRLRGHSDEVHSAAFSPDGRRIATCGRDGIALVWSVDPLREVAALRGHSKRVNSVAFSPDGTRIVTASEDGSLRIWDGATGQDLLALRGHASAIESAAFSSDGTRLLSFGKREAPRIWHSVPYAARYRYTDTALTWVQRLITKYGDWSFVAESIRSDANIDGSMRKAALNLVLRRSHADRVVATQLVEELKEKFILGSQIVDALQSEPIDVPSVRAEAMALAHSIEDSPERLNDDAWNLVRLADGNTDTYARGLLVARLAADLAPGNPGILNTLGIALYRAHDYSQALAVLSRSDESHSTAKEYKGGVPADVAFIAMSLHQLGRADEARAAMERLRGMMQDARYTKDADSVGFLREAERLLQGHR